MSKKRIGIVGWPTGQNSFGITKPYFDFINYYLGRPIILSPDKDPDETIDMLIVPGGPDVDPIRYNQVPNIYTGNSCVIRETFDHFQLPWYIENNTPIFGICRGHQSIAVFFGAKLIQHMYHETNRDDRTIEVHKARIVADLPKIEIKFNKTFGINSLHHQIVNERSLNKDEAVVTSIYQPKTGNTSDIQVESIVYKNYPIATVQWHPEEINDLYSIRCAQYLLKNREPLI